MKVMKFGGTSVANAARITALKDIVLATLAQEKQVVVVVSALGGLTDQLIAIANKAVNGDEVFLSDMQQVRQRHYETIQQLFGELIPMQVVQFLDEQTQRLVQLLSGVSLIKELSPRTMDVVMAYGESVSSYIVAHYLQLFVSDCQHLNSLQCIRTNSDFGNAQVDFATTNALLLQAVGGRVLSVMGGFIATDQQGTTTTLGRGGSDYTASIVGAALGANEIQIWTDVNGVMTADPRKVKKALSLADMTYEEAFEMSYFGAKVIHPPTIQPALEQKIPLRILNSLEPSHPGTLISATTVDTVHPVKGISSMTQIALLTLQGSGMKGVMGIAGRLFSALAKQKINIILITQASSEHSISFAVSLKDAAAAQQTIAQEFEGEMNSHRIDPVLVETDLAVVAIIGANMRNAVGVSGRAFGALARNGINIRAIAQGSSELNISVVVSKIHETKALNALHEAFFLADTQTLHVFMVGVGLIGRTLLQQMEQHAPYLLAKQATEIKVVALSNSRQMCLNVDGIAIADWENQLQNGTAANTEQLVREMLELNLPNSIFVDCTAHPVAVPFYETILANSIAIVTPNKIANSGSQEQYNRYQKLLQRLGKFRYETNVGAGLPIIGTLNNLLQSGDEVLRIEAVLSGSLSFIFNNFDGTVPFSDIVRQAKTLGYTEPDPRDDLSGLDVARKVLILARETGVSLELSDIQIENPLPKACQEAPSVDDFFVALDKANAHFAALYDDAHRQNRVLRFLASIEGNTTKVGLRAIEADSPFGALSGSDNMVVFTTSRYKERPLVVKGPGAGAEVTAAGVFAEIVQLYN